ncbi:hypothetical protein A7A78_13120 [Aequorivita soesokkakensis]|uniref:Uncharacterized protein n=1 Tax=Aequorivita soesokkakensis TaxID=1385699 RepID=A0A1A9LDA7_9FLAO|nr:hypothetical protein A7A78_13120 [Aequorivita soesokkakensis]
MFSEQSAILNIQLKIGHCILKIECSNVHQTHIEGNFRSWDTYPFWNLEFRILEFHSEMGD